ncbi:Kinesin-like protein KIP2 [Spathaspora sp. JA1]|nr:Kinesin-like protein KIP2 [Spathaspora sp. JA1]
MTVNKPLRPGSNMSLSLASVGTPPQLSDFKRPPSRHYAPPMSPIQTRIRPGSAMGRLGGSNSSSSGISRPSTPIQFTRSEPYTGTINVSIRPNPHTINPQQPKTWEINSDANTITNLSDGSVFPFDNVFDADSNISNRQVYQRTCSELVDKFVGEGFNGTVFAYGMTGSGKTFSIKGVERDPGFVELAIEDIFNKIDQNKLLATYNINISYLEIYNEKIIDLLSANPTSLDLKIRDDPEFGIKVIGLSCPKITSKEQLLQLIKKGDINRKTSATDFNSHSSRSHSILQIKLTIGDLVRSTETKTTLSLCDLAGSERAASSLERRKEGSYINKSLLALSNVINRLSSSSLEHVPYRDSKLTRLLQPALSGCSLVSILCTIHMGSITNINQNQFAGETYKTLRFAARAKNIVINIDRSKSTTILGNNETTKLIQDLNMIISRQKIEIEMLKNSSVGSTNEDSRIFELESENKILLERIDHFTRLSDLQRTETAIVKNDVLNDILGSGIDQSQIVMANIEDFYKRTQYEISEQKNYITQLEQKLKLAYQTGSYSEQQPDPHNLDESKQMLKDQEEEIYQLKEQLKDKDQIIKGLSKTSRLRKLVESSNITNIAKESTEFVRSSGVDKENEPELRPFKISPKKTRDHRDFQLMDSPRFAM